MTIAEKIQELRKKAGLSQEQLADQLHVSRQAISKWESGLAQPTLDNCKELCRVFQIEIDELISDKKKMIQPIKKEKQSWLFIMIILAIWISGLGMGYLQKKELENQISVLQQQLDQLRMESEKHKTEYINTIIHEQTEELREVQIFGTNLNQDSMTLNIQLRLKKQNETTQVGCSIKSNQEEFSTQNQLNEDYSFTVTSIIPYVNEVDIQCYKTEDGQVEHLLSEKYVVSARFKKDFVVTTKERLSETGRIVLGITMDNSYGVYDTDSKGNPIVTTEYEVVLKEKELILSHWNKVDKFDHAVYEVNEAGEVVGMNSTGVLTTFAYLEEILEVQNSEDLMIEVSIKYNDDDPIIKTYTCESFY